MKKVRYLIGAAGVAPALGLMMSAGNASAGITHAPTGKAKAVSLAHIKGTLPRKLGSCPALEEPLPREVFFLSSHSWTARKMAIAYLS